jgi:hypothetical protein
VAVFNAREIAAKQAGSILHVFLGKSFRYSEFPDPVSDNHGGLLLSVRRRVPDWVFKDCLSRRICQWRRRCENNESAEANSPALDESGNPSAMMIASP